MADARKSAIQSTSKDKLKNTKSNTPTNKKKRPSNDSEKKFDFSVFKTESKY